MLLTAHLHFLKFAKDEELKKKDEELKKLEYWKNKSTNYLWMINSIEKLIHRKVGFLRKEINDPTSFRVESVWKNLQMLYELYEHISKDPSVKFKIVFFVPSLDNRYLASQFWYNPANQPPYTHGNEDRQKIHFSKDDSDSTAVTAWRNRKTEIAESEDEIDHHYKGQEQTIKSIIAYPIFGQETPEITGIITITADKSKFFKWDDIATHEEYIKQFGIRIALELCRLRRSEEHDDC